MLNTFVINLDRRPDRLHFVKAQLDDLRIPFERFPAIDGQTMSPEQKNVFDESRFLLECKKMPVIGEIGCALSHRAVWQRMVDENLDYALILEDDIRIHPKLAILLADEKNYHRYDFLNLAIKEPYELDVHDVITCLEKKQCQRPAFWQSRKQWRKMESEAVVDWRIFSIRALGNGMIVCECDPAPALACCYILSQKAAQQLLVATKSLYFPIDKAWHHAGGMLREACLAEPLATQTLDSDILNRKRVLLSLGQRIQRFFVKSRRLQRRWDVLRMYGWTRL